jgi:predicted Rossmann-fold nucleotide-binding protein
MPTPALASRPRQICVLGSAEPGSPAFELAGAAGELIARLGLTLVSGCGSPATRVAAERALAAGGTVVSIVPSDDIGLKDWPCTVLIPCGMGDARNLLMALAGDACLRCLPGDRRPGRDDFRGLPCLVAPPPAAAPHRLRGVVGPARTKPTR